MQETKWIMAEVEKGDEEDEGGGREEVSLALWVFLSGFGEGGHNSFNWFLLTQRDFFLFYWAKGGERSASSLLLPQQSL